MKCPKCGYHSFDYLDSCKKCNNDLTAFKSKHSLRSLIFPNQMTPARTQPESDSAASEPLSPLAPAPMAAAAASTDFGFDFMDTGGTPPVPEPAGLDLPELDEAIPQTTMAPLSTEDDTFSWDEEPEPAALPPAGAAGPDDDFDWDDEETPLDVAAGEEEITLEETESDDSFGLDLSWDADLPTLDEEQIEEEEPLQPMDTGGLPDWDFDEDSPPEDQKAQKPKKQEEPRDPFDLRGSGAQAPSPATFEIEKAPKVELPLELESKADAESLGNLATKVIPVIATATITCASEPMLVADPEDAQSAREEDLPPGLTAVPTLPSPFTRGLALAIDLLILAIAILLFLMAGEAALKPEGSQQLLPSAELLLNLAIPYFLVLFSVCFGYFTLFHFLTGQTPGKMLLHLRVETKSGTPLAFSQAFLRSTGGLFSLLPLGLGFLVILFDPRRRGWNDRLASTLVVAATPAATEPPTETATDQQ